MTVPTMSKSHMLAASRVVLCMAVLKQKVRITAPYARHHQPMRCSWLQACYNGPPAFEDLVSHCVSTSRCTDNISPLLTPYLHNTHMYTHRRSDCDSKPRFTC